MYRSKAGTHSILVDYDDAHCITCGLSTDYISEVACPNRLFTKQERKIICQGFDDAGIDNLVAEAFKENARNV